MCPELGLGKPVSVVTVFCATGGSQWPANGVPYVETEALVSDCFRQRAGRAPRQHGTVNTEEHDTVLAGARAFAEMGDAQQQPEATGTNRGGASDMCACKACVVCKLWCQVVTRTYA